MSSYLSSMMYSDSYQGKRCEIWNSIATTFKFSNLLASKLYDKQS